MRVYLPATLPLVERWWSTGAVEAPADGAAVTPALREWFFEGDAEELEYAATVDAARLCLARLAADPAAPRRRVVLAVDVPDGAVRTAQDTGRSAVTVTADVPTRLWAAVLVDEEAAAEVVEHAVAALPAADAGDDDAAFAVDEADALELQWFAVQEIPALVRGAPGTAGEGGHP